MNEVTINGRKVAIKELTVREIRAWYKELDKRASGEAFDLVDDTLFEEFTLADIAMLTDLKPEELEDFTPGQLREIMEEARKFNADFFSQRKRLALAGTKALQQGQAPKSA